MRIPALLSAVLSLVAGAALADANHSKYLRQSDSERREWISYIVNKNLPDASAERQAQLLPGVQECVEGYDEFVPSSFWAWADVCVSVIEEKIP